MAPACKDNADHQAEAGAISHAIDEVRDKPLDAKAGALDELRKTPCTSSQLCGLRDQCAAAYEQHVRADRLTRQAKLALLRDAGTSAATLAHEAEQELKGAAPAVKKCADRQAEIVRALKLK